ncbi:MAG: RNA polymerase sigma factor [Phycisphaerae bacterium]
MLNNHAELIEQATRGDQEALSDLLAANSPALRQYLQHELADRWRGVVEVDDVLQVTFLEAFLGIAEFVPAGPSAFANWLRRIADNNLRDAVRKGEREGRRRRELPESYEESCAALLVDLFATSTTPSRAAQRGEAGQLVRHALERLPDDYAQVIRLSDLEGRNGPEVAQHMHRSPGAVRMLLARARERLRQLLVDA